MMITHNAKWLATLAVASILFVMLGACTERATPRIESQNIPITEAAQTSIALTNAPPTAGPSPTPSPTSTPYMTATPFPGADPTEVVAEVGDTEITLAEYQARVRYERWLPLHAITRSIERFGAQRVLDLTAPENAQTLALFYTLGDSESLGYQSMDIYLTEQLVLQEAARRDLELEQSLYDSRIAARIGVELGRNGERPATWDDAYTAFLEEMQLYTGMSESQFLEIMRALTYYEQLRLIIGEQTPLEDADIQGITAVTVRDLLLNTQEDAVEAIGLLEDGAAIATIAREFDLGTDADAQSNRIIRRGTEGLTEEIIDAIFDANEGDVIGPIATNSGWYIAVIGESQLDILQPADIEELRDEYYRNWILERLENEEIVTDYETWQEFIPTDPLPRDVSPFMQDEFFTLPPDPFAAQGATVTPAPLSDISPR